MSFDLRLPIAALFSLVGLILAVFGLVSGSQIYDRSLGINMNLDWGLCMLIFGIAMFLWSKADRRSHG
jgi:peptidoglycan/LPS O-acetylase OafA/YrhL